MHGFGGRRGGVGLRLLAQVVLDRAFLAFDHVVEHRLAGGVGIARGDGLDDAAVLAGRDRHQPAVGQVQAPEQAQLLDQLAVDRGQLAVAGELDQPVVELQVQQVVVVGVFGLHRRFHLLDQAAHFFQLRRGDVFGQAPADEFVHRGAQVEDLDRLVDGDVAHEHAAVLFGAHQPGFFEHAKGLAQRPARHAEPGGQRHLGQLGAGRQFAGKNHAFELALHHARQRAGLQQRDRWMGPHGNVH